MSEAGLTEGRDLWPQNERLFGGIMRISISDDITRGFKPAEFKNVSELVMLTSKYKWSGSIFKNGHRKVDNFVSADVIAFDIDNVSGTPISIEKAKDLFSEYRNVILPTKSHRLEKAGVIADRYRIIIPFEKTITDPDEYYGAWREFYEKFPFIDKACKDPSRYWEPSTKLEFENWKSGKFARGIKIERNTASIPVIEGLKGNLLQSTYSFLLNGAPNGSWNNTLFQAALDFKSQGYSIDEARSILICAARRELGNDGELDFNDTTTIESAFAKETTHNKRGSINTFNFQKVGELLNINEKMNWMVDGLLTTGGLSIIAGAPKSGKSTIIRQLGKAIAQGGEFLGRKCKQGSVLYLALEEQRALLSEQLRQLGVTSEDPFFIHCGPVPDPNKAEALKRFAMNQQPMLIVIDTLVLFADGQDINNYNEMYKLLSFFRDLAREIGCHITFVHHQNKSENRGTQSIMGSSAIHGAVDCAMIFSALEGTRYVTTSQRGGLPFDKDPLVFNKETQSYSLGVKEGW
jgi:hypothetical protein